MGGGYELCLRFVLDVLILLILSLVPSLSLARSLALSLARALTPSVHSGKWPLSWLGLYRGYGSSTRLPYASSSQSIYKYLRHTQYTQPINARLLSYFGAVAIVAAELPDTCNRTFATSTGIVTTSA